MMSDYRRWFVPGGTYFFTVVTHGRRATLTTAVGRQCLRAAFQYVRVNGPITIVALVLLPDHVHAVWTLPPGDGDYSTRWRRIKGRFTSNYLAQGGSDGISSNSRAARGERAIWQRRFWEHACRDEADLKRRVDYIHWNPVKHGLVGRVRDYPWSSFQRFVQLGEYSIDWGGDNPCPHWSQPED
jgi:putative transposase